MTLITAKFAASLVLGSLFVALALVTSGTVEADSNSNSLRTRRLQTSCNLNYTTTSDGYSETFESKNAQKSVQAYCPNNGDIVVYHECSKVGSDQWEFATRDSAYLTTTDTNGVVTVTGVKCGFKIDANQQRTATLKAKVTCVDPDDLPTASTFDKELTYTGVGKDEKVYQQARQNSQLLTSFECDCTPVSGTYNVLQGKVFDFDIDLDKDRLNEVGYPKTPRCGCKKTDNGGQGEVVVKVNDIEMHTAVCT